VREQNSLKTTSLPLSRSARLAGVLETLALVCVLLAALALAATSLFAAAKVNPDQYEILQILVFKENQWCNLAVVALGIVFLVLLGRIPVSKRFNVAFGGCVLIFLGVFGAFWVTSVNAHAESDGDVLIQIAERIIAGDYAPVATSGEYLHYYLVRFPYQCGLLFYLEVLVRLFGATGALGVARMINVALLVSSYGALLLITQRLFRSERVTFLTILLLCATPQPVLSCTFVYGLIPALAFGVWAFYFIVCYLQSGRKRNLIPAAVLLAAGVFLRSNTWIMLAAAAIVLALHALRRKKPAPALLAVLLVVAALPLPGVAQRAYEERLGTSFGSGYPKSYWMAMSLQDGWKAAGWHVQAYQEMMQENYGEDVQAIDAQAKADIRAGVSDLIKNPSALGEYLFEKLVSQWDEPTFLSIWITKSVKAYEEPEALAKALYSDQFDRLFRLTEGQIIKILYFGFVLSALALLRKHTSEQLLLPVTVLGGFLFHLLFEAKSQYVLEYLPLLWPLAAFGVVSLGRQIWKTPGEPAGEGREEAE